VYKYLCLYYVSKKEDHHLSASTYTYLVTLNQSSASTPSSVRNNPAAAGSYRALCGPQLLTFVG
jgi:hypothetical protein